MKHISELNCNVKGCKVCQAEMIVGRAELWPDFHVTPDWDVTTCDHLHGMDCAECQAIETVIVNA